MLVFGSIFLTNLEGTDNRVLTISTRKEENIVFLRVSVNQNTNQVKILHKQTNTCDMLRLLEV